MAERDFEQGLERLFAEAPAMSDADAFAQRITRRVDRGWTARRLFIGAAGVVGGVIGVSQLVLTGLGARMEALSLGSVRLLAAGLDELAPQAQRLAAPSSGGLVVWAASALAVAALGFALSRALEEI